MKQRNKRRRIRKILLHAFILLFLFVAAVLGYLSTLGFPGWLLEEVLQRVESGSFTVQADELKLDLTGGLIFKNARFYRKQIIGPPAITASRIGFIIDPLALVRKQSVLREIIITDGVFYPDQIGPSGSEMPSMNDISINVGIVMENCVADGVPVENLTCDLFIRDTVVQLNDIEAIVGSKERAGPVRGDVIIDMAEGIVSGHMDVHLDPHVLLPVVQHRLPSFLGELIERFEFVHAPPRCEVEFRRELKNAGFFSLNGTVWLQDCSYRNNDVLRADGNVEIICSETNMAVVVNPLLVIRPEGNVAGDLRVDIISGNVTFNATSSIQPVPLLKMIGIYNEDVMGDWKFLGPVNVTAKGQASFQDFDKRTVNAHISGRKMGIGRFIADDGSFDLNIFDKHIELSKADGHAFGGSFAGNAVFDLPDDKTTNVQYKVAAEMHDVNATRLINLLMTNSMTDVDGTMYCQVNLEGKLGEGAVEFSKGSGKISIADGKIFSLPVFGGLSEMMGRIIPGLNFVLRQSNMNTDFTVTEGVFHTENIKVEGDLLSLSGRGDYRLDGGLDFDVQIRLLKAHTVGGKVMRVITYPISKLFEFKLRGGLSDPKWHPMNFSSDVLETMGFKKPQENKNDKQKE